MVTDACAWVAKNGKDRTCSGCCVALWVPALCGEPWVCLQWTPAPQLFLPHRLQGAASTGAGLGSPASRVGRQGPCPAPDFSEGMTNLCVKGNKGRTMPGRISKSHRDADVQTLGKGILPFPPSLSAFWLGVLARELLVSVLLRPLDWAHIAMLSCYRVLEVQTPGLSQPVSHSSLIVL